MQTLTLLGGVAAMLSRCLKYGICAAQNSGICNSHYGEMSLPFDGGTPPDKLPGRTDLLHGCSLGCVSAQPIPGKGDRACEMAQPRQDQDDTFARG